MNRDDFQALADLRLDEAKILHAANKHPGAYHVAGYSIECALKACIAKGIKAGDWPPTSDFSREVYTHSIRKLLGYAGLERLEAEARTDPVLGGKWAYVSKWTEQSRYDRGITAAEAADLIDAIENPQKGILPWIKRQPEW